MKYAFWKKDKIEPKLSIGDFVEARISHRTQTGMINNIKKETAEYVVNTNKAENYKTYGGSVLGYERVTKIETGKVS
jgi:hypothetical protein